MTDKGGGYSKAEIARKGAKVTASTVAGASLGVVGGIAGITAAAIGEVVLPVVLCLWATGLAGGALGLLLGVGKDKRSNGNGSGNAVYDKVKGTGR